MLRVVSCNLIFICVCRGFPSLHSWRPLVLCCRKGDVASRVFNRDVTSFCRGPLANFYLRPKTVHHHNSRNRSLLSHHNGGHHGPDNSPGSGSLVREALCIWLQATTDTTTNSYWILFPITIVMVTSLLPSCSKPPISSNHLSRFSPVSSATTPPSS